MWIRSLRPDAPGRFYYHYSESKGKCQQTWFREKELEKLFGDAIGRLQIDDQIVELIKAALKKSHEDEEKFVKDELTRLQSEYSRNESKLHKVYEDKLEGVITEEFFRTKYEEIQQRQIEIHAGIEGLRKKNSNYFEEGIETFELMKNIKNQYVKADPAQKHRIMKILVSNCELKGVNTRIYWNKPFDILFEMGQTQKWGRWLDQVRTCFMAF